MEQHPVPQNVTTFQFRLIGDMTVKQFGYLVGGGIAGYICYKLPLPFFFTWPLAVTSVLLGIGLAFVPIEERPMDIWLLSFIKSIYSPTQYLWSHEAGSNTVPPPAAPPVSAVKISPPSTPVAPPIVPAVLTARPSPPPLTQTLEHLFGRPSTQTAGVAVPAKKPSTTPATKPAPSPKEAVILSTRQPWNPLQTIKDFFMGKPNQQPPVSGVPAAYPAIFTQTQSFPSLTGEKIEPEKIVEPAPAAANSQQVAQAQQQAQAKEQELTEKLTKLQAELTMKTISESRILELQKQLTDVLSERGKMEQELASLRQKLTQAAQGPQVTRQAGVVPTPTQTQPTVRVITPESAVRAGLPRLTTFPNVVTGIIKDAEGELLPAILVTVRDTNDIPVRALKTNKLGQFAASTQLPNGVFTIDIEDPRGQHFFDRVRVTLNGSVLAPIEVTSKSKKEMDRDKLAKEIFGGNQM